MPIGITALLTLIAVPIADPRVYQAYIGATLAGFGFGIYFAARWWSNRGQFKRFIDKIRQREETALELAETKVTASLASGRESITKRIDARIRKELAGIDESLVERVSSQVLEDVTDTFRTLQLQATAAAQWAGVVAPPVGSGSPVTLPSGLVHPGSPRVIRWIALNEKKYEFFAIRFLREKVFASDPEAVQGLQFCIDKGLLEVYYQPNPKNPVRPTKACRLNRTNPLTMNILG